MTLSAAFTARAATRVRSRLVAVSPDVELLYTDEQVAVANKPSGLLVHRGWDRDDDVLMFRVRDAIGQHVHPLHRLDRGTSGAVLFARDSESAARLASCFREQRMEKRYLALVRGHMKEDAGRIDYAIPNSEDGERVPAATRYEVLARSSVDRCSLVWVMPETGRLHQIRRHLRHLGHPLVGDVAYGDGKINRHYRAGYGLHRLALHASALSFPHPSREREIRVTAGFPSELRAAFAMLFGDQLELAPSSWSEHEICSSRANCKPCAASAEPEP